MIKIIQEHSNKQNKKFELLNVVSLITINIFWLDLLSFDKNLDKLVAWKICIISYLLYLIYKLFEINNRKNLFIIYRDYQSKSHIYVLSYLIFSIFISFIIIKSTIKIDVPNLKQYVDIEFLDKNDFVDNKQITPSNSQESKTDKIHNTNKGNQLALKPNQAKQKFKHLINRDNSNKLFLHKNIVHKQTIKQSNIIKQTNQEPLHNDTEKNNSLTQNNPKTQTSTNTIKVENFQSKIKVTKLTSLPIVTDWHDINNSPVRKASFKSAKVQAQSKSMAMLDELQPIPMAEIVDKNNDTKSGRQQSGGNSTGGQGKNSKIQKYLIELKRTIQKNWNPPIGKEQHFEVEFEINKLGQLQKVIVLKHSQDSKFDQSAINTLNKIFPWKKLPDDYNYSYLRVRYFFNYNLDKNSTIMSEIDNPLSN